MQIGEQNTIDKLIKSSDRLRLNMGCGSNKIEGFLNIDAFAGNKPDLILDITKEQLPFVPNLVDEIVFFHCIEHIEEKLHDAVLEEFFRVLKPGGILLVSYPEFLRCASAYAENRKGQREFWKATIFGLQRYPGDFHVALMDTPFFINRLRRIGFGDLKYEMEPEPNEINTVVRAIKGTPFINREDLLREEIYNS